MSTRMLAARVVAAIGLALGSATAQGEVVIGAAGPVTGAYAALGEQMKAGADMAVRDINAAGGLLGQQLRLIVGDDACDPRQAVSVASQFAGGGVIFVAGHFCSGSSIPASQVYHEEGILQISPASTNPQLTEQGFSNVFRVCGRDDQQGVIAARYIAEHYRGKRIAILHDKSAYGKGLADATKSSLNAAGITETMYEPYTAGESDYSALVSKLKRENIDVVYVGGYHTEAGLILRQLREQGSQAQMISGDALVTDEFWSITGPAGEGTLMTFSPDPRRRPEAVAVVQRFRAAGYEPEGYTLYTYAAIQVFADAARTAGSTELDKLVGALRGNTFRTVLGDMSFDEKGDRRELNYVFYRWSNGSYGQITD